MTRLLAVCAAVALLAAGPARVSAAPPVVASIAPTSVAAGSPAFTITVTGTGFGKKARVTWNGTPLETTWVSSTTLNATVTADLVAASGTAEIAVAKKNKTSNAIGFEVRRSPADYDWTALRTTLQSFVPGQVRGLTFVLARDGQVLFAEGYGTQTVDSVRPIASATKMPSALAIMTLVDDGRLDLDEPVGTYLAGHLDWPADKAAITVRMLLDHTSGLEPEPDCLGDRTGSLHDCAQAIAEAPLEFAPGTAFAYGGGSFQMAGYVAEVISGEPWNQFFAERVGGPLGLTRFTYTDSANPRIAGGASSDAGDYDKILEAVLAGHVLTPATLAEMERDQIAGIPKLRSPGGDSLPGYSFGWWHSDPSLHPGSAGPELSDPGAFGTTPWIDLDLHYSAVLLIYDTGPTGTTIWNAVRPVIITEITRE